MWSAFLYSRCTTLCCTVARRETVGQSRKWSERQSRPAERLGHAGVFDVLVSGEALDEDCDHLQRDVLHQTGQSDGRLTG